MDMKTNEQPRCKTCGEPELTGLADSGEFGWFTDADGKTWCNKCGSNPTQKSAKAR